MADPAIGMTMGLLGILDGAAEFMKCCEIYSKKRDYRMVSKLGEETATLTEQSRRHEGNKLRKLCDGPLI